MLASLSPVDDTKENMDAKEEVRQRLAIEDVIGEYVQLKRAGRNWKGLSPFGSEKTPSFVVSPDKGIWHDFSSGKGGDMFSFVMEMEGLEFRQALELLARRAGVDMEQYKTVTGRTSHSKERLYEANELACKFYQTQFSQSKLAYQYALGKRGFTKETALQWRLGYSPSNGTALVDFLKKRGFTEQEIKLAGLSSKNYRGSLSDMFRGRLQIPLCDDQGRVVGFTARLLADDPKAPKYINTPSTPLYDKSRHVFGLHLAKEAIRKTGFVVLAEGNLDVISSHQTGVRQVVATAGTALTEPHLKALNRLTGDIRLCFDADKAGIAATERAIPVASKIGVSLQIVTIPNGKDPDELVRQDVAAWKRVIEQPQYAADWLIERYVAMLDISTAQGKRRLSDVVLEVIRQLNDAVEQDHYLGKLAEILQVNKTALIEKLAAGPNEQKILRRPKNATNADAKQEVANRERLKVEERLLALALLQPKLREYLYPLTTAMLQGDHIKEVFEFLQEHPDFDGSDQAQVKKISEYGKILSLIYETLYQDVEALELKHEAARLQHKLIREYVRTEKQALVVKLQETDSATAAKLLVQVGELDKLLKDLNS